MATETFAGAGQGGARGTVGVLALLIGLAWLIVLVVPDGMHAGPVAFVPAWSVMMVAMMLPSAAPLVLLYRRGATPGATAVLAAGYLAIWAASGVPAFLAHHHVPMMLGPVALALAGVYQLTPLKLSCLARCRSPADFLVRRWGRGPLRLGVEHGLWCLACCWALMLVLVAVGAMGLAWVVGVAALVAVEKLAPAGVAWSRVIGVGLLSVASVQGVLWLTGS